MSRVEKLTPPVSVRMMATVSDLEDDAAKLDRVADRIDHGDDAETLLALGRRLRRHANALNGMAWEADSMLPRADKS